MDLKMDSQVENPKIAPSEDEDDVPDDSSDS